MKSLIKELLLVGHFMKLPINTNKPQKQKHGRGRDGSRALHYGRAY